MGWFVMGREASNVLRSKRRRLLVGFDYREADAGFVWSDADLSRQRAALSGRGDYFDDE